MYLQVTCWRLAAWAVDMLPWTSEAPFVLLWREKGKRNSPRSTQAWLPGFWVTDHLFCFNPKCTVHLTPMLLMLLSLWINCQGGTIIIHCETLKCNSNNGLALFCARHTSGSFIRPLQLIGNKCLRCILVDEYWGSAGRYTGSYHI